MNEHAMIRVNGREEARAALIRHAQATEMNGRSVLRLLSPPYAACHAGVGYYAALVAELQRDFPDAAFTFILCCGDNPAIAHDALRLGFRAIICACSDAMAAQWSSYTGATILRDYPLAWQ